MKFIEDELISKSLNRFSRKFKKDPTYNIPLLHANLKLQKRIIRKIVIPVRKNIFYPASIFYFYTKMRHYITGLIDQISSGNKICSIVLIRVLFDHFVMLAFLYTRGSDQKKHAFSYELWAKYNRELLRTLLSLFELFEKGKPKYTSVLNFNKALHEIPWEHQVDISKQLKLLINTEISNTCLDEDIRNRMRSEYDINNLLCVRSSKEILSYWGNKLNDCTNLLNKTWKLCEEIDKSIESSSSLFPFESSNYFTRTHLTLYKIGNQHIHASYMSAGDTISDEFDFVRIVGDYNLIIEFVTLNELLLFSNWIMNKELKLGFDDDIVNIHKRYVSYVSAHRDELTI